MTATDHRVDGPVGGRSPTIGGLLDEAARALAAAGVAGARREALALWAAVSGTSPGEAWVGRDASAPRSAAERFARALEARADGAPMAYAVGHATFRTLELAVDTRVLIPRPETEGLVQRVLGWAERAGRWGVAADVGTGSGCIALSLAAEGRFTRVLATDLSPEALAVARANAARLAPRTPVEFRLGDLLWALSRDVVDAVVANPPYVTTAEWETLGPEVREREPRLALVGGPDGLRHTEALLRAAPAALLAGGLLAMEVDCQRAVRARELARALGWRTARLEEDLFGRPRYLLATREDG